MNVEASEAIVRGLKSAGVDLVAILPDPEERAKKVRPESLNDPGPGRGWRRADYLRNYMARKNPHHDRAALGDTTVEGIQ